MDAKKYAARYGCRCCRSVRHKQARRAVRRVEKQKWKQQGKRED